MNSAPDTSAVTHLAGDLGAGHVLGRYELLMPIAAGGMAMVWAARLKGSRGFQKIFAVKTMLPKLSEDEQFEQMFLDEASLASQIRHPHVVEIIDLGEQQGVLYLVMEWIDGVPLNQLMKAAKKQGGIPNHIAVRIVMQACAGLHAAHELRTSNGELVGLVHRDVSPQNILVTYDGVAKVVDFGVAKATAAGDGATVAGQIKGKVGYMAPEQVKGEDIDRKVDIFALGIVLYALTTGKHPFRRESEAATMYNICSPHPVVSPSKVLPDYPKAVEDVLLKALAKEPSERYQTGNDLFKALDRSLPSELRSTDDDVAEFVRGLMGDRRDEQKKQLAAALERADQIAASNPHWRAMMDSQGGVPVQHPVSQISGITGITGTGITGITGADHARPSMASLEGEMSGTGLASAAEAEVPSRRWFGWVAAAVVVAGVGIVAFTATRGGASDPESSMKAAAPAASENDVKPSQPPDTKLAEQEAIAAAEPPKEAAAADAGLTALPPPEAKTAPRPATAVRPAPATPKPAAKPAEAEPGEPKSWKKLDPGF